jgi:NNP family nitrate/nitrite transporter-like MFS transporter
MPAIFDHFRKSFGFTAHKAWRVSFTVPFAIIIGVAFLMLALCPDTPTGKWSDREIEVKHNLEIISVETIPHDGAVDAKHPTAVSVEKSEMDNSSASDINDNIEAGRVRKTVADEYTHEVIQNPSLMEFLAVAVSPQTLALMAGYFCSFGAEIAINSILGSFYLKNFPKLGQTSSGRWAAMFGLLNVYGRPLGGIISDLLYRYTGGSLWAKKAWVHGLGIMTGVFCIIIGVLDSHDLQTMVGLVAGLAFFMDAGNGANFGLVPHVHPYANGIVSGLTGAAGNFGGVSDSSVLIPSQCTDIIVDYRCHHLPIQWYSLRKSFLDHGRPHHRHEFGRLLDQTCE